MDYDTRTPIRTIILSILILILSQICALEISSLLVLIKIPDYICNVVAGILYIIIGYYLLKLLCIKYLDSSLDNYYITKIKISWKWLIIGLLLPLLVAFIYFLLPGKLNIVECELSKKLSIITDGVFFIGIAAGIVEEMIFRGMMMNSLNKRYNKKIAIIIPSLVFGFIHILGMNFNIISSLLVILSGTMVGIMFSLIAEESKSIWNSAIVHSLWNIITASGLLNIGNSIDENSLYNYVINSKSSLITGGEFGVESSIISLIGYILVSVVALFMIKKKNNIR